MTIFVLTIKDLLLNIITLGAWARLQGSRSSRVIRVKR
jgi:hypothetical protein